MEKELSLRCGKPTPYDISTPITMRRWYVEGAGQLCEACWNILWPIHIENNGKTESKEKSSKQN